MDIQSTRIIGSLTGGDIIKQLAIVCETNYVNLVAISADAERNTTIINLFDRWLKDVKHVSNAGITTLKTAVPYVNAAGPVWAVIVAAKNYVTPIQGD